MVDVLAEWSQAHGGYDVSRSLLVRNWLRAMTWMARPMVARGVPADAVTAAGVAAAVVAARSARRPARRPAAAFVLLSAVLDGLDGAVARQRGSTGARGVVVDRAADRVADVLFPVALRRAGCPRRLAVAAGAASVAFEALRDARRAAGRHDIGTVTVAERPFRVVAVSVGLVTSPVAGAVTIVVMSGVGAWQLVVVDRQP